VEQTTRALSAPEFTGTEPAEIESAGNGSAENGMAENGMATIDHRVSLVRAAR